MTTQANQDTLPVSLTISQVADSAGVTANAVRFYERYGIVTAHRTSGNARRFSIDAVCRIKLAKAAQRVGLTLKESSEILTEIPPLCPDIELWSEASNRLVAVAEERIRELQAVASEYSTPDFLESRVP